MVPKWIHWSKPSTNPGIVLPVGSGITKQWPSWAHVPSAGGKAAQTHQSFPLWVLLWTQLSSTEQSEPNISISLWLNPPGYVTSIYIPAALLQAEDIPLQQLADGWAVCEHQSLFHLEYLGKHVSLTKVNRTTSLYSVSSAHYFK